MVRGYVGNFRVPHPYDVAPGLGHDQCEPEAGRTSLLPGAFDLIFIDADHNYESVKADIAAWRGALKPGGIMCGHDYLGDSYGSFPGVDRAVHEAFGKENILRPSGSVWRVK